MRHAASAKRHGIVAPWSLRRNRIGPHTVVGLVGAGGMGDVYEALDTRLDADVALKIRGSFPRAEV